VDHDDLLEPSLTEEDDATGFAMPWNPWSVVVACFFCGAYAGGALMAWNFRRLGQPRDILPCLAAFLVVGLLLAVGLGLLIQEGVVAIGDQADKRLARFVAEALIVVLAMVFAKRQKRRYDIYVQSGGEPGPFLRWGALGFLVGGVATVLVYGAVSMALGIPQVTALVGQ